MKIILDHLPGTASSDNVKAACRKFERQGKVVETERRGGEILIYMEEKFEE